MLESIAVHNRTWLRRIDKHTERIYCLAYLESTVAGKASGEVLFRGFRQCWQDSVSLLTKPCSSSRFFHFLRVSPFMVIRKPSSSPQAISFGIPKINRRYNTSNIKKKKKVQILGPSNLHRSSNLQASFTSPYLNQVLWRRKLNTDDCSPV